MRTALVAELHTLALKNYAFNDPSKYQEIEQRVNDQQPPFYRGLNAELHLSASTVVFRDDQLLMVKHPYLHQWLLPAGHVEYEEAPSTTALRELLEETGLTGVNPILVDINLINIPANPVKHESAHQHIDCRYWVQPTFQVAETAELSTRWVSRADAPVEFQHYFELLKV